MNPNPDFLAAVIDAAGDTEGLPPVQQRAPLEMPDDLTVFDHDRFEAQR